jgi:hypothetical protein
MPTHFPFIAFPFAPKHSTLLSGCLRFQFKGCCGVTLKGGLLLWLKPPKASAKGNVKVFDDDLLIGIKNKNSYAKKHCKKGLTLTERWRKLSLIILRVSIVGFFGVVVGAVGGHLKTTSVCKTLVTAFRAANSFLKNFGFRAFGLSGFLICYLSALAWVGVCWTCGYFA